MRTQILFLGYIMLVTDFSDLQTFVNFDSYDFSFDSFVSATSTSYSWLTPGGATLTLHGTDIALNIFNEPVAGTITSASLSYANGNPNDPDLVLTGFDPVDLSDYSIVDATGSELYAFFAGGDTTLIGPETIGAGWFFGDFGTIIVDTINGDDFFVTGTFGEFSEIVGSTFFVEQGATLNSGTLTFDGAAPFVSGDAYELDGAATLFGGDDSITMQDATAAQIGYPEIFLYGDVIRVDGGSILHAGDDTIDARAIEDTSITRVLIRGDTFGVFQNESGFEHGEVYGGNDTLYGSETIDNYIIGDIDQIFVLSDFEAGNDTIYGGAGNDYLAGDARHDAIFANDGGDDVIYAGGGHDSIYGGDGADTIYLQEGSGDVDGGDGDDLFVIEAIGTHAIDGGSGNDTVSFENSTTGIIANLIGSADGLDLFSIENINGSLLGNDTIHGRNGANTFFTFGGNDKVYAAGGGDTIDLGDGNDQLYVEFGRENNFNGGSGNDLISYQDAVLAVGVDLKLERGLSGNAIDDTVIDFENLYGSQVGDDTLKGTNGSNKIKGLGGDDLINGRGGDDTLVGGSGNDIVKGGSGNDKLIGGSGDDKLKGGTGDDKLNGSGGNDKIKGAAGDDIIKGGRGNDQVFGGGGDDSVKGGGGRDIVHGDKGDDKMWGNGGADIFVFERGDDRDTIMDFQNDADTIQFAGFRSTDPFDVAEQVGRDVVFNFGSGDTLTVENTTIGALQNDVEWL